MKQVLSWLIPPIKAVVLQNESDIVTYRDLVAAEINVAFPVEYFSQGLVRAFVDPQGTIKGGYLLVTNGPYRTVSSVPEGQLPVDFPGDESLVEVTALFLDRKLRSGLASAYFWYWFVRDSYALKGKTHFVYAYDTSKAKLGQRYSHAKPKVVFQGHTKTLPGGEETPYETIEIASIARVQMLPLLSFTSFISTALFVRNPTIKKIKATRDLWTGKVPLENFQQ